MAQQEGFYVTLPSDDCMDSFPNNTLAQFKTLLPQAIYLLDGEWEVCLPEMMYPNALQIITDEELFSTSWYFIVEDPDPIKSGRFHYIPMAPYEYNHWG